MKRIRIISQTGEHEYKFIILERIWLIYNTNWSLHYLFLKRHILVLAYISQLPISQKVWNLETGESTIKRFLSWSKFYNGPHNHPLYILIIFSKYNIHTILTKNNYT